MSISKNHVEKTFVCGKNESVLNPVEPIEDAKCSSCMIVFVESLAFKNRF